MRKKYLGWLLFGLGLLATLVCAMLYSVSTGEVSIALSDIPRILSSKEGMEYFVLTQIRMPRIVLAIAVGGSLGLTGSILQGIYRNPLVEPYTLGISGGASLGVAIVIVLGLHAVSMIMLPLAGFIGALATIFLVYTLSIRKGSLDINRMLLIGVMISFVASSAMMFLMSISTAEDLHSIVFWIMGSLDEPNTQLIYLMLGVSLFGLVVAYSFARPLNALQLGQSKAEHLGINASTAIRILFVVSSLMAGICVAVAGVIGFVGLIIPHLVRIIIGSDFRISLIGSFLGGGLFLVVSDVVARTIIAPNELPIGVITGIVGGLIFMVVLSNMRRKPKLS
ncbi:MAG: iron ABC transporter permease [Tenuifilaceae bacterium]|jgi:iron complex transport system permease protein|nr:iron ABC transporter permease [Tenuifilaceae bacterium]